MINQAIIPLAGLGTRLLPLTKSFPKEMWPLGKISILERILSECLSAGIKEIFLIISDRKKIIKDYFESDKKFEKKIFKNKFHPLIPCLGIFSCAALVFFLPTDTWLKFIIWNGLGLFIYLIFGYKNSRLNW